jgi:hypothetical protein
MGNWYYRLLGSRLFPWCKPATMVVFAVDLLLLKTLLDGCNTTITFVFVVGVDAAFVVYVFIVSCHLYLFYDFSVSGALEK